MAARLTSRYVRFLRHNGPGLSPALIDHKKRHICDRAAEATGNALNYVVWKGFLSTIVSNQIDSSTPERPTHFV
jgi:hypothetical protein